MLNDAGPSTVRGVELDGRADGLEAAIAVAIPQDVEGRVIVRVAGRQEVDAAGPLIHVDGAGVVLDQREVGIAEGDRRDRPASARYGTSLWS